MNIAKNPRRHWGGGRPETRTAQDKEGKDRHNAGIIANGMKMLGNRSARGDASEREGDSETREPAQDPAVEGNSAAKNPADQFSDMDHDIPF